MKFSVCNELFEGWELEEIIKCASELGFEGVEIAPYTICESVTDISKQKRSSFRALAEEVGIQLVGVHWILMSPSGLHINHPEKTIRTKTRDYMLNLIEFCADLGGQAIVVGCGGQRKLLPDVTYQQAWDYTKESLAECAQAAEPLGVYLGLEPLSRDATDFINTADEAKKLVDEINHPNLHLTLDCYSMSDEGKTLGDIIRSCRGYISHFHANDDNRREPGSGKLDFTEVGDALREVRYENYVSIEVFEFEPDPRSMAERGLNHLKKCFGLT